MSAYYIFIIVFLLYAIPCVVFYIGTKKEAGSITPVLFIMIITWPYWMLNYAYDKVTSSEN